MILSASMEQTVANTVCDFKKFTGKRILAELEKDPQKSCREWMPDRFRFVGANDKKITNYRFWHKGYHSELVFSHDFYRQKLDYIHDNPMR